MPWNSGNGIRLTSDGLNTRTVFYIDHYSIYLMYIELTFKKTENKLQRACGWFDPLEQKQKQLKVVFSFTNE